MRTSGPTNQFRCSHASTRWRRTFLVLLALVPFTATSCGLFGWGMRGKRFRVGISYQTARSLYDQGRKEEALRELDKALVYLDALSAAGEPREEQNLPRGQILYAHAKILYDLARFDEAVRDAEAALPFAERTPDDVEVTACHVALGYGYTALARDAEAFQQFDIAQRAAATRNQRGWEILALRGRGALEARRGEFDQSDASLSAALRLAQLLGSQVYVQKIGRELAQLREARPTGRAPLLYLNGW